MLYKNTIKYKISGNLWVRQLVIFNQSQAWKKNEIDLVDPAISESRIKNFKKIWKKKLANLEISRNCRFAGKLENLKYFIDEPNLMSQFTAEKLSRFSLRLKASNSSTNCSSLISLMLFKLSSLRHSIYIRTVLSGLKPDRLTILRKFSTLLALIRVLLA